MATLPHVHFDPAAAAAAATACRDAADDLRVTASALRGAIGTALHVWSGAARGEFDRAATELADDLMAEADALDATADDLDGASRRAVAVDRLRQETIDDARRRADDACVAVG